MGRKDYAKAAEIIRCSGFTVKDKSEQMRLAASFCNFFSKDNVRFNREKFLQMCNLEPKK